MYAWRVKTKEAWCRVINFRTWRYCAGALTDCLEKTSKKVYAVGCGQPCNTIR